MGARSRPPHMQAMADMAAAAVVVAMVPRSHPKLLTHNRTRMVLTKEHLRTEPVQAAAMATARTVVARTVVAHMVAAMEQVREDQEGHTVPTEVDRLLPLLS